jgi:ABC-2 type transport system ATP-binding protein
MVGAGAHVEGATVEVTVDQGPRSVTEILGRLAEHGVDATTLTVREPSLDDVFLNLTGHRATVELEGADA